MAVHRHFHGAFRSSSYDRARSSACLLRVYCSIAVAIFINVISRPIIYADYSRQFIIGLTPTLYFE